MGVPVFVSAGAGWGDNNATADVAYPAGIQKDDVLIFQIWIKNNTVLLGTDMAAAGWTQLHSNVLSTDGIVRQYVFGKRATGSESGSFTIARSPAGSGLPFGGRMYAYRGCARSGPFHEGGASGVAGNSSTVSDVGVTCQGVGRLAVNLVSTSGGGNSMPNFTGESGGDWAKPVERFTAAPGGSRISAMIQDADMPEGGTIDGGACTQDTGGRQAKHGFALIGAAAAASYSTVIA